MNVCIFAEEEILPRQIARALSNNWILVLDFSTQKKPLFTQKKGSLDSFTDSLPAGDLVSLIFVAYGTNYTLRALTPNPSNVRQRSRNQTCTDTEWLHRDFFFLLETRPK